MKIYVGCALNNAPQEFRDRVALLKQRLEGLGYEIVHFLGLGAKNPDDVYHWDIKECVYNSDMMLAICDFPSLGLGYEMATMIEKHGRPVLAVAHKEASVSWLIQGISHHSFSYFLYETDDDIILALENKRAEILSKQ